MVLIFNQLSKNEESVLEIKTKEGYNLDLDCSHDAYTLFDMKFEWTGGSESYTQNSGIENGYGQIKKTVPTNNVVVTLKHGNVWSYLDMWCDVKSVASSTTGGSCATTTKSTCKCGQQSMASRIVGGSKAVLGEVPWQVGILYKYANGQETYPFCGGTIVSAYHVITAAHCITIKRAGNYAVIYGTLDYGSWTSIDVQTVYNHKDYEKRTYKNDITVMKLKTAIPFSATVAPACLPDPSVNYAGKDCLLSGWGDTSFKGQASNDLLKVVLPLATTEVCKAGWSDFDETIQVCTVGSHTKDTCQGDSGGPLVIKNNGNYELVGVVSSGYKCAAGKEGLYTRVTAYLPWINKIICETSSDYFCTK